MPQSWPVVAGLSFMESNENPTAPSTMLACLTSPVHFAGLSQQLQLSMSDTSSGYRTKKLFPNPIEIWLANQLHQLLVGGGPGNEGRNLGGGGRIELGVWRDGLRADWWIKRCSNF